MWLVLLSLVPSKDYLPLKRLFLLVASGEAIQKAS
jgi:hypothetical protein